MRNDLALVEQNGRYWLQWKVDGELGGVVGESVTDGTGPAPKNRDLWEMWVACKTLLDMGFECRTAGVTRGFIFESRAEAVKAKRAVDRAINGTRPMPAWALEATKAGWRPPKGWKP